jgi:hypothetical protein
MTETKGMDWVAFFRKYRRQLTQSLVIAIIIIPLIRPLGLPLPITEHPKGVYAIIETLGPENKVICSMNIAIGLMGDVNPGTIAIFHHLFRRGVKLYIVGFNEDGVAVILEPYILAAAKPEDYGYVYGKDWCVLGYVPGGTVAWSTFAANIRSAVQYDKYGNYIDDLPMMKGVNSLNDFDIILDCGGDHTNIVVEQWADPYNKPYISSAGIGGVTIWLEPYFKTGQLDGYVAGVTQGAEYEQLVGITGKALSTIDGVALSNLLILTLVILGNIMLFKSKVR